MVQIGIAEFCDVGLEGKFAEPPDATANQIEAGEVTCEGTCAEVVTDNPVMRGDIGEGAAA